MFLKPVKTTAYLKTHFPQFVWNVSTANKTLYLTFDDGPTPKITNWVLDTLSHYEAKATFFCIGKNIGENPQIFWHILEDNHTIGNHTYNHLNGWKTKTANYIDSIISTQNVISLYAEQLEANQTTFSAEHLDLKLFRPPYGKISPKQSKTLIKMGYKIVMWDVLSFDWDKGISKTQCLKNVIESAKPGSIIVFHDSVKASHNLQYALPKVLEHFSLKGFEFKAL